MGKLLDLLVYGAGHISNTLTVDSSVYGSGFIKTGSSDDYFLLGGGGHSPISSITDAIGLLQAECTGNRTDIDHHESLINDLYGNQIWLNVLHSNGLITDGNITPEFNNVFNLGSSSLKWANVYATTFTGNLSGNASTATAFSSARTISLTGNVTGSASSTGASGWSITTTIADGAVTNAKLVNSSITLAGRSVSLGGSISKANMIADLDVSPRSETEAYVTLLQGQIDSLLARDQFSELYSEYAHIGTLTADTINVTESVTAPSFIGALTGNADTATTATKLGSSTVGSSKRPIYLNAGSPTQISYTIEKSVPSNAVFTDTTYSNATTSAAGLMSSSDKTKLDGISTGANAYSLPTATSSTLGGVKIGSTIDISSGIINITKQNVESVLTGNISSHTHDYAASSHTHNYAASSHTHSYLPLSGGTMTGTITPSANNTYNLGSSSSKWANVYATTFTGNLSGNASTATTATSATKLTTGTTGSTNKPVYFLNGTPVVLSGNIGTAGLPVYINNGTITQCNASSIIAATAVVANYAETASNLGSTSVGSTTKPIYLNNGSPTSLPYDVATTGHSHSGYAASNHTHSNYLPLTGGTITGVTSITNTTDSTSSASGALKVSGGVGIVKNVCIDQAVFAKQGFYEQSDRRNKNIVEELDVDLDTLTDLSKVKFIRLDDNGNEIDPSKVEIGMIAQELEDCFPEVVHTNEETGRLSVAYEKLAVVALAAIDKLNAELSELKSENKSLKNEINLIKEQLKKYNI